MAINSSWSTTNETCTPLATLAQSVLLEFGLSSAMLAADTVIQKKIYGTTTRALIISNEELEDIIKIVKLHEESGWILKRISETVKNEANKQKVTFLSMLLGTIAASILGSELAWKGVIRADEGVLRAGQIF